MSLIPETKSTSPVQPKNTLADERGNIKISSQTFGVSLNLVKAGEGKDEQTGRVFTWGDSVKIVCGDKSIKLTAMQAAWLGVAFSNPEVSAELKARVSAERAKLLADVEGLN